MKTYFDPITNYAISTENRKILSVTKKPLFRFDFRLSYTEDERKRYGSFGTAMFSGITGKHYVEFENATNMVDTSGGMQKTDLLACTSVCGKTMPDIEFFRSLSVQSFYTDALDFMPIFGYVCFMEKILPVHCFFEEKSKPISEEKYEKLVEVLDILPGDDLGQLAQYLLRGNPAYNDLMTSAVYNPFYGNTISLLPLKDKSGGPKTPSHILISRDAFYDMTKDTHLRCLSSFYPTRMKLDESGKKMFGPFDELNFYSGLTPEKMSLFWGIISQFSNDRVKFFYAYAEKFPVRASVNMIGREI